MKTAIKAEDDDQVVDVSDLLKRRDQLRGKLQNLDEQASVAPPATKKPECHWDYVIKEVCWLAEDFQRERTRHTNNAKKLVKATEAYAKTVDQRKEKKTKEELQALKKVSAKVSREVRKYWLKINQLITLRQKQESEEIRQQAMEKHLQYLVRQTERYASVVAHQLSSGGMQDDSENEDEENIISATQHPPKRLKMRADADEERESLDDVAGQGDEDDDDSYMLSDEEEDNESTLLEQEEMERREREERKVARTLWRKRNRSTDGDGDDKDAGNAGHEEDDMGSEVALLQDEANLSVEELARKYGYAATSQGFALPSTGEDGEDGECAEEETMDLAIPVSEPGDYEEKTEEGDNSDDDSFVAQEEEEDDESTLLEQEEAERKEKAERKLPRSRRANLTRGVREQSDSDDLDEIDENAEDVGDGDSEVAILQDEANMSVEELARKYGYQSGAAGFTLPDEEDDEDAEEQQQGSRSDSAERDIGVEIQTGSPEGSDAEHQDDDESFVASDEEEDNESTLLEQEELERQEKEERMQARRQRHQRDKRGTAHEDDGNDENENDEDGNSELAMLRDEANMSVEELARKYGYQSAASGAGYSLPGDAEGVDDAAENVEQDVVADVPDSLQVFQTAEPIQDVSDIEQEGDDDVSYMLSDEEEDNESTLLEQEEMERREREERRLARRLRRKRSTADEEEEDEDESEPSDADSEVAMLQDEANMSIEELAKKYGYSAVASGFSLVGAEDIIEEKVGTTDQEYMSTDSILRSSAKRRFAALEDAREEESVVTVATKSSRATSYSSRLTAMEAATRTAKMPLPFILRNINLREYQHIGMSWLISLHDRRLNGILADEMGLGKTIQTIAALAYLALYKGIWGPHLIIVPTSCIVNWECELKKFCPAFKILTYFGTAKQRKTLRVGWSKLNTFHICITSYQIILSDNHIFRRKKWYYMILDEAHHIKNYMSKKWQVLLCFNTCRRLLLSGTPLQNNILELWSLLHFLMPYVFNSRKEFAYWFADPLNKAVENGIDSSMMNQLNHGGDAPGSNTGIVSRLHTIIRPFILRRLKSEVATQLPNKYEYVLYCKMSKRQLYLYEEFISRNNMGGTKAAASSNSYISMMNILMQLRKICNHPNLLEPRVIHTPYIFNQLYFYIHKGMHFASQPFRMTDLSLHYLRLYDIKTQAIFVEDVHVSTLQHALVETKDKTIATFIRECLSRYQQLYASELHSTASSATLPRLVPSFLAVISSRMCSQLFKHVDVGHKHVRTWRNVTLHDSLSTQLLQSYFDLQHSFSLMVPKVLSSGVSSNITYMSNEERLFRTPYYSLSSEPQAKELGSDALSTCQQVLLQRRLLIFPDKKFIQYDCGKLQLLAQLLHKIKQNKLHSSTGESHGSHHGRSNKVLIFTQMSKMLDILEIFLNLHQFTFVRLDGSTSVDKRQYLMDRFNNDEKIFVFILSTRSGGLGINLTGANHVIFYDTDWNPAMDAQAQDRAHRIGQTRDVHIYRLITESTIEENILLKNRQKKKLDILVMNQGNFKQDVLLLKSAEYNQANSSDLLLSAYDKVIGNNSSQPEASALQQYEDAEDVQMLQRTAKEMSEELQEFDEKNIVPTDKDADEEAAEDEARGESGTKTSSQGDKALQQIVLVANDEKAVEEEFNSFLTSHGNTTFELIQSQLSAVDRYAMQFRTVCEPFYSMYFVNFAHKTQELLLESNANALNIEEIEAKKEAEELQAITNGDIIASFSKKGGASSVPLIQMETIKLVRQVRKWRRWYIQERRKKVLQYKLDKLMGKEWVMYSYNNAGTGRRQAASVVTYYHNFVTNEISYAKPKILEINEEYAEAQKKKFNHIPNKALLTILSYLPRHPEHTTLLPLVNRHFYAAVHDSVFVCKVLSIENSNSYQQSSSSKLSKEKVFLGLHEALATCQSYDRVYLSPGHHWINSAELAVSRHVIIYSDESAECIVELSGRLVVEQGVKLLLANIVIRSPDKVPYTIHSTTTPSVPAASAVTTESTSIILAKPGCSISANNLQVVLYQQPVSMRQLHQQSSNSNISYVLQHKSAVWELQGAKVVLKNFQTSGNIESFMDASTVSGNYFLIQYGKVPSFQVSLIRIHPGNNVPSNSSSHGSSASSASSASNEFFFFDSLLASTSPQAELVQCAALCAASAPCVYLHHCDLSALLVDFSAEGETQIVASQVHSGSLTYIRRGAVVSISNSLLPAEWTRSSAVATVLGQKVKGKA